MSSMSYFPLDTSLRNQLTLDQFGERQQQARDLWDRTYLNATKPVILVGWASCSVAHGCVFTFDAIRKWLADNNVDAVVRRTGCFGPDYAEPLVDIIMPGQPRVCYREITADKVPTLLDGVLRQGKPMAEMALCVVDKEDFNKSTEGWQGIPAALELDHFKLQKRIVMANMGYIDPESVDDYIARGGYEGLKKVLTSMTPDELIKLITDADLRGRGGAGFTAGIKWAGARAAKRSPKYVICNAHEGEPNVFKDRRLLESDPHHVLEGMIIQSFAVGTPWAYFYVGDEYPLAIHRTKEAVRGAYAAGLLGDNILGTGFSCHVDVQMGGGAYISGEASALMFGIEGKRAMPRTKPPRSVEAGLWGLPTCVNNVETMINVPDIVMKGADWYKSFGTDKGHGTKLFTLMGNIEQVSTSELEMGVTMRELVYTIGGGCGARPFKAIQTGGPSGGCLPDASLDLPMDFSSLDQDGGTMGSGGYVVYDDSVCIIDMSRYFNRFNRYQSCGKCFPCRIGTKSLLEMTDRISFGGGRPDDLAIMSRWSEHVVEMSLCGLGQTAPLPLVGGIRWFREEFEEHITDKYCRTGTCVKLNDIQERKKAGQTIPQYEREWLPVRVGERARASGSLGNKQYALTAGDPTVSDGVNKPLAGGGNGSTVVVAPRTNGNGSH